MLIDLLDKTGSSTLLYYCIRIILYIRNTMLTRVYNKCDELDIIAECSCLTSPAVNHLSHIHRKTSASVTSFDGAAKRSAKK